MSDVSSISTSVTSINALSNLILVSPQATVGYQPQNFPTQNGNTTQKQPSPILFHYEGTNTVEMSCDITDHFIEDNSAIQDQIAIKPTIITVQGFIGELNDVAPIASPFLKAAQDKLLTIAAYQPDLTATAIIAYDQAFAAYQLATNIAQSAVQSASSIAQIGGDLGAEAVIDGNGIFNPNNPTQSLTSNGTAFGRAINLANQTKQQIVFQQWAGYIFNRTLFTVQTPWAIYEDMAIQSMKAIQDDTTNTITDFEMTFKQMRFASSTDAILIDENDYQNRAANQAAPIITSGQNATSGTLLTPLSMTQGILA